MGVKGGEAEVRKGYKGGLRGAVVGDPTSPTDCLLLVHLLEYPLSISKVWRGCPRARSSGPRSQAPVPQAWSENHFPDRSLTKSPLVLTMRLW